MDARRSLAPRAGPRTKLGGQPHPRPEGACGRGVTPTAPCRRRRVCRAPATSELRAVLRASQTPGSRRVFQLLHDRSRGPGGWPAAPKPTAALPGVVTQTDKGRAGVPAPREGGASRNHTRGGRQQRRCGHCQVCCVLSVSGQKRRRSRQKTTVRQGIGENSKKKVHSLAAVATREHGLPRLNSKPFKNCIRQTSDELGTKLPCVHLSPLLFEPWMFHRNRPFRSSTLQLRMQRREPVG